MARHLSAAVADGVRPASGAVVVQGQRGLGALRRAVEGLRSSVDGAQPGERSGLPQTAGAEVDVALAILATALGTERPALELRAKAYSAAVFWALVTVTFLAMLLLAVRLRVHVR